MTDYDWGLLEDLCSLHAVSGREDQIIRFLRNYLEPLVDKLSVDNLGNIVVELEGTSHPDTRLMLQAHVDELGLIVRNITEEGYLLIERVGGLPEKSLLGQRMDILTDQDELIPAYVGTKSHHITTREEKFVVPRVHDLFLDVGLRSRTISPGNQERSMCISGASMMQGMCLSREYSKISGIEIILYSTSPIQTA